MKKINISESLKNVTKISFGTVAGQIISIATLPFITRLYSAEIIGIWTTINAMSNIVQNICDLGLSNSLMMCEEKRVQTLHSIITMISTVISFLSAPIVFLYYLITGNSVEDSVQICILMALYAFTLRKINISQIILNRKKEYNVLMMNSVIRFSAMAVVSILLGLASIKSGFFWGNIAGQILCMLHMYKYLPKHKFTLDFNEYRHVLNEHKNYVKYQLPASLTVTLRTELPNLLVGSLFGNTILGYYSISQKLLTIPVTFLGQSLGKVFYQKIAYMKRNKQKIGLFVERSVRKGMIVSLIPLTLLAAYGDVAVTIFFGLEYSIGGIICRIIVYRTIFNFISTAIQGLDVVLDRQQYVLYTCLAQTILSAISVFIGYYFFDSIYVATIFMVITFILVQITYYCKMYQVMNLNVKKYLIEVILLLVIFSITSFALRYIALAIIHVLNIDVLNQLLKYFV